MENLEIPDRSVDEVIEACHRVARSLGLPTRSSSGTKLEFGQRSPKTSAWLTELRTSVWLTELHGAVGVTADGPNAAALLGGISGALTGQSPQSSGASKEQSPSQTPPMSVPDQNTPSGTNPDSRPGNPRSTGTTSSTMSQGEAIIARSLGEGRSLGVAYVLTLLLPGLGHVYLESLLFGVASFLWVWILGFIAFVGFPERQMTAYSDQKDWVFVPHPAWAWFLFIATIGVALWHLRVLAIQVRDQDRSSI